MSRLVIGLCGYAGSGKDTFANMLEQIASTYGLSVGSFSFASPMRAMLRALGVPARHMAHRDLKEQPVPGLGLSYRHLAQTLGTEWGRKCNGEDFWLKALALKVEECSADVSIISDVRFPNEAAWVNARPHGFLLRLDRGVPPVRAHESEAHVMNLPALSVDNNGSLTQLEAAAKHAMLRILESYRG